MVKYISFCDSIWKARFNAANTDSGEWKSVSGKVCERMTFIAEADNSAAPTP